MGGTRSPDKVFAPLPVVPEQASTAARGPGAVTGAGLVADLAAELRAGKLTSRGAIEVLLDRVVAQQVGPEAPAAVRAALEAALDADPFLAQKLRALEK